MSENGWSQVIMNGEVEGSWCGLFNVLSYHLLSENEKNY
jgi:hypothetical protein